MDIANIIITHEILKLIAEIDEFKGRWQGVESLAPERLSALKKVATIESIGSSTRIEGAKLTDEQVEQLLSRLDHRSFTTRDEQEVAGYAEVMDMIFSSYNNISFTENHIKQLHGTLLKYSDKDERHRGEYKTTNNHVEAFDGGGKSLGVVFETATPFETPRKMQELMVWYNEQIHEKTYHPLILIGLFIVVFLAIHPFADGNGRLSRVLATLLLLRSGYDYVPYSSMESVIEANKDNYYVALRRTQKTLKGEQDWDAWMVYFLSTMVKQKNILADKVKEEQLLKKELPSLSRHILDMVRERGEVSVKDIEHKTGANRNTIKLHFKNLVEQHYLRSVGKGRGTKYILQ